jgi:predicted RNA binding protein YcfA (HicA-like mRNA interferase family)
VKQVSGKDLARVVQKKGWSLARIQGSHPIFTMPGRRERLVIPIHGNCPLKVGLLRSLLKIVDMTQEDLEEDRTRLRECGERGGREGLEGSISVEDGLPFDPARACRPPRIKISSSSVHLSFILGFVGLA